MNTGEVPMRDLTVKARRVPKRTLDAMRERAAEEGVSLTSLIRRALSEWLEVTEGQPRIEGFQARTDEPTQATPTVSVPAQTHLALNRRGWQSVVIPLALDEWLML